MNRLLKIIIPTSLVLFAGCESIELESGASSVEVVLEKPTSCKYLGQVRGAQGNFFTGGWTSNANLEQGAMNQLRNEAAKIGADTVYVITNRASNTCSGGRYGGGFQQTGTTLIGNAYKCNK